MNSQELRTLYLQNCIADAVEALLAVLDALDPDSDLEPDLGDPRCDDREADYLHPHGGTADWEGTNEDGVEGDPHGHTDHGIADRDALDSEEFCLGGLGFDGSGQIEANRLLAKIEEAAT